MFGIYFGIHSTNLGEIALKEEYLSKRESLTYSRGRRYLPFAFTEQGIYTLMTALKGEVAIKQSKALIHTFKKMKDYIVDNYIEVKTLVLLKDVPSSVEVIIFSDNIGKGLHTLEYQDFCQGYPFRKITFQKSGVEVKIEVKNGFEI